jgi:glycerol-3-phosphate dehydrogenase subunit B
MYDLVVIGAGLAGLSAAYAAVEAGLKVKLIAKGLGSIFWGAGTVDLLGFVPGNGGQAVRRPTDALPALFEARPQHPYTLLGAQELFSLLAEFQALTEAVGLPYAGAAETGANLLLPSPAGAARPTWLAPRAQIAGDLGRPEPMVIVGFRGMRDFFPELIAENLRKQDQPARAAFLPLTVITDRHDANNIFLAEGLDQPEHYQRLGKELRKLVRPGERIGLPAVLGMEQHATVLSEVSQAARAPVFEIPTLPPSVPGMRLFRALRRYLEGRGVFMGINMTVIDRHAEDGRMASVETFTSSRPLVHRADRYLLASGGILGGGINTDHTGRAWEEVFALPLAVPQGDRTAWFHARFMDPAGHPIFQGGVPVDERFQPVNGGSSPVYSNVWAAGGVLAHADPIEERSLEGMAIATGMAAARAAAGAVTGATTRHM